MAKAKSGNQCRFAGCFGRCHHRIDGEEMTVFCLFENDTDGYTYSAETLVGVFETKDDAELALLQRIKNGAWYDANFKEHSAKYRALKDSEAKRKLREEWQLTLTNKGLDFRNPDLGKRNVDDYTIEEIEVGKMRNFSNE